MGEPPAITAESSTRCAKFCILCSMRGEHPNRLTGTQQKLSLPGVRDRMSTSAEIALQETSGSSSFVTTRGIKKVLLHTHLEGSLPAEAVDLLSARNSISLPFDIKDGQVAKRCLKGDWMSFRTVFEALCSCFQKREDFADALICYAQKLRAHNVVYAEIQCSPWKHLRRGISLDQIAEGLLLGALRGREYHDVEIRIIIDVTRNPNEDAGRIADWMVSLPKEIFVALGISGGTGARPRPEYSKVAAKVKSHGFFVTVHAGELEGPESVYEAISYLNTDRIGHGVRALEDPALVDLLLEKDIHLEVCPTANRIVGVGAADSAHIRGIHSTGLSFSINTDDELIFETDPTQEFDSLVNSKLLPLELIPHLMSQAASAAFGQPRAVQLLRDEQPTPNASPL